MIALLLCVVTVFGIIAGAIAGSSGGGSSNVIGGNQASILDVLKPKTRIKDYQLEAVVEKNKAKDFKLETVLSILGNPGAIMTTMNGVSQNYATDVDIKTILNNFTKLEGYSKDSIIQLMWLTDNEDLVFTYIATEANTPTITGMSLQSTKETVKGAKYIPTTTCELTDFNEYTTETLKNFESAFVSAVQYPLLECAFTKKNIAFPLESL